MTNLDSILKSFANKVPSSQSYGFSGEGNGTPLQYSCLENPMGGGARQAAVHGVAKSWTRLNDFAFTFHFHALEKEMATHSSVLAWRIPGTGSLVGCHLWGLTELDTTEATQQQQQQPFSGKFLLQSPRIFQFNRRIRPQDIS